MHQAFPLNCYRGRASEGCQHSRTTNIATHFTSCLPLGTTRDHFALLVCRRRCQMSNPRHESHRDGAWYLHDLKLCAVLRATQ
jgi:hypothetical protein